MENQSDYKVNRYFFLAIILLLFFFLFYSLVQFFSAFLGAVMFYVLSRPLVEWLTKRKGWKKGLVALLIILISFFLILLPVTIFVSMLYSRISSLVNNPANIIAAVKNFDATVQQKFDFQLISTKTLDAIPTYLAAIFREVVNQGLGFFATITMMYFFLYFMILNINRMEAAIILYLPFKREKINRFGKELVAQTFSNAVGIPLIAIAQGLCAFACYWIAAVPEPGFWGVLTAFASVLPIIGSGLIWLPISLYLLLTGQTWQGIFVIGWSALVVGTIDNILRFILAKRMADVHPVVTVLGVIMGLQYFGFTGLIFGPLLISYFLILLQMYYAEYQQKTSGVPNEKKKKKTPAYMQRFLKNKINS